MYFAGERLSIAELSAASLDGHLVGLGEGYMPADAIETVAMRAASLRPLLGTTMAAALRSAAWVWGALDRPPTRHSAYRAVEHRLQHVHSRRLVLHDVYLGEEGRMLLGGVWVGTPLHTVIALVRAVTQAPAGASPSGARVAATSLAPLLAAARSLVEMGLADPAEAVTWLDARPRMPGKRAARALLLELRAHVPSPGRPGEPDTPGARD